MSDDTISRQAAIDCVTVGAKPTTIRGRIAELPSAQQEHATCYLDSPCEYQNINIALPSVQTETPPYVAEIESEYKKWVNMPHINKPLAKALYEVWKRHDREDVGRNG